MTLFVEDKAYSPLHTFLRRSEGWNRWLLPAVVPCRRALGVEFPARACTHWPCSATKPNETRRAVDRLDLQ